jgi:hypothetical protein
MKVSNEEWNEKNQNLMQRRKTVGHVNDNFRTQSRVADYASHMSKVQVGASLLDVGCGSCFLKGCIPDTTKYYGLDAMPLDEEVFGGMIEDDKTLNLFT